MFNNQPAPPEQINRIITLTHPYPTTARLAQKIYRAYGSASVQRLTENPYTLARDVRGIGEQTAAEIAKIIEEKLNTRFNQPALKNPNVTKVHFGGPGNGKLSDEDIALLKDKLQRPPADILHSPKNLHNPNYWTIPDLKQAIKKWFNVSWASDSSYRSLFKKCNLYYSRKQKAYLPERAN